MQAREIWLDYIVYDVDCVPAVAFRRYEALHNHTQQPRTISLCDVARRKFGTATNGFGAVANDNTVCFGSAAGFFDTKKRSFRIENVAVAV